MPIGVLVTNTKSVNNTRGVRAIGPNVTVRLDDSRAAGNGVGTLSGGQALTLGNNVVRANGSGGVQRNACAAVIDDCNRRTTARDAKTKSSVRSSCRCFSLP